MPAGKKRLAEIDVELTKVTTKFSENVLDSTNALELMITDEAKLAGLPPSAIAAARQSAESKKVDGLAVHSAGAQLHPGDDLSGRREIREQMYRAYSTRATEPSATIARCSRGFSNCAGKRPGCWAFRISPTLCCTIAWPTTASARMQFLEDLKAKTEPFFAKENARSKRSPDRSWSPGTSATGPKSSAARCTISMKKQLRPYFPAERVVDGMFEIVERLYGIQVKRRDGVPVWHPDVRYYEVHDRDGLLLGAFYADWYPRETKRGGAWMDGLSPASMRRSTSSRISGCVCGNLTPPVGDKPALLTHREVETIFHEFGHLLHHVLSRVEVRSLAGTAVAWDFVELPSQIMENWCWEREALDLFARHYETGEAIPEDLFQKMMRARTFRAANAQMRQLGFGFVDLTLHREYDPARDGDVIAYAREILQPFAAAPFPENYAMIAGFTHLFASPVGYGAGYYSYKWAEVLDADAFTRFRDEGIFSREVGAAFREKILSQGDSEDPAELYRQVHGTRSGSGRAAAAVRSGCVAD